MHDEFGGFIAPLWAVYDSDASNAVLQFLQDVLPAPHGAHLSFAAALQNVRRQLGEQSPAFLSYIYYGDVMAQFV
jgi:hypothetical protein